MKSYLVFISLFVFLSNPNNAQEKENVVKKGNNIINFYYGYSFLAGIYKSFISIKAIDLKVETVGPVGMVYEHMMTKRLGLGAEFGYTQFFLTYTEPHYFVDNNTPFQAKLKIEIIRAMFRANFHFINTKNFDGYGFMSAGYKGSTYDYSSNDPHDPGLKLRSFVPVGFKPGVGFRYFFIKNLGLNLEFSFGSPLIGGGLSIKF